MCLCTAVAKAPFACVTCERRRSAIGIQSVSPFNASQMFLSWSRCLPGCSECFQTVRISPSLVLVFEEPEDPSSRSFFSEIISSISDVKFSHSGRYMMTRDYLSVKVWDLNMENRPVETYQVRHRSPDAMFIHENLKLYYEMQEL